MKILLTFLAASLFSIAAFAQTSSDPATEASDTQMMGSEEVYSGEDSSLNTPQAEEDVSEPGFHEGDDSLIQEEVDSSETEESMRSDTMDETGTIEGSDTSEGTSTP